MGKIVYNGREYLSAGTASTMQGATSTTDGVSGLVPQPLIADREKFLKGDGTWGTANEVTANPSGTATDTLQKVDIDGTIYDIQGGGGGGSNLIVDAQIYSFEEKQVGVWTDGKPLYQRTWEFSSSVILSANTWFTTSIPNTGMEKIINVEAISETGTRWAVSGACDAGSYVNVICFRNSTITVKYMTIQYTKTTDAAGSGGYQAYGFTPVIYSTEEREVGVWVNNKPLYQKSINIGVLTMDSSFHYVAHNIANIDEIVDVNGVYQRDDGSTYSLNLMRPTTTKAIMLGADATNIQYMNTQQDDARYKAAWVTLYYTKTTDVAGSSSYNTLGVPNVHYDGNEKVIGTWFDETLYETTLDLGSERVFSSGWNSVVAHQNKYNLIFDGKLISPSKLGYNVDLACNDTTNLELHTNHNIQGRYLTFKYTKTS